MLLRERDFSAFEFRAILTDALSDEDRATVHGLFDSNYRAANHAYLDKSLGVLRHGAIALDAASGEAAGFALGEVRVADLPRLPSTTVALAGICCVSPAYRRRGLFGALEQRAMVASGLAPSGRWLSAGRMAHPASMRQMMTSPHYLPRAGVPITRWQRAVGRAVAELYGATKFHDDTFVVEGSGTPIGYPVLEIEVEAEEWAVFEHVDRDRGDALLGIAWRPDAPEGWYDAD